MKPSLLRDGNVVIYLVEAVTWTDLAVCCGSVLNRDLFYQDPVLFGSQHSVDSLIDDAALVIQVPRSQIHVVFTHVHWSPCLEICFLSVSLWVVSLTVAFHLEFDLDSGHILLHLCVYVLLALVWAVWWLRLVNTCLHTKLLWPVRLKLLTFV